MSDAIEARVGMYANYIASGWCAVIPEHVWKRLRKRDRRRARMARKKRRGYA